MAKRRAAYRRGEVTQSDFVGLKQTRKWGDTRYTLFLKAASANATERRGSMAMALIWLIQYSSVPEAKPLRHELMRLSGRQTKKCHPETALALLAGLWALLSAIDLLERYTSEELQALARQVQHAMGHL